MIYVDAENIILSVKRIGERVSAVFSRILASLLKVRPRFGIIALRKLTRFRIDEILFDSSRIFSVKESLLSCRIPVSTGQYRISYK